MSKNTPDHKATCTEGTDCPVCYPGGNEFKRRAPTIPDCLMYCGALGHEITVTEIDKDGFERVAGECNTVENARTWLKPGGHIYQRTDYRGAHWKRRWKRVE